MSLFLLSDVQFFATPFMNVLHISDLHFGLRRWECNN